MVMTRLQKVTFPSQEIVQHITPVKAQHVFHAFKTLIESQESILHGTPGVILDKNVTKVKIDNEL